MACVHLLILHDICAFPIGHPCLLFGLLSSDGRGFLSCCLWYLGDEQSGLQVTGFLSKTYCTLWHKLTSLHFGYLTYIFNTHMLYMYVHIYVHMLNMYLTHMYMFSLSLCIYISIYTHRTSITSQYAFTVFVLILDLEWHS